MTAQKGLVSSDEAKAFIERGGKILKEGEKGLNLPLAYIHKLRMQFESKHTWRSGSLTIGVSAEGSGGDTYDLTIRFKPGIDVIEYPRYKDRIDRTVYCLSEEFAKKVAREITQKKKEAKGGVSTAIRRYQDGGTRRQEVWGKVSIRNMGKEINTSEGIKR